MTNDTKQAAPPAMNAASPRYIPDSECVQSRCARSTTGCWGECTLKRNLAVLASNAASPVQMVMGAVEGTQKRLAEQSAQPVGNMIGEFPAMNAASPTAKRQGNQLPQLVGRVFERWTVVARSENGKRGESRWECRCECGTVRVVIGRNLLNGISSSCGCYNREAVGDRNRVHGHAWPETRTYRIWAGMIGRCTNPNATAAHHYGGRGIEVCERWMQFDNFLADMGEAPDGLTLERTNVNGNYEPSNCIWADVIVQANNRRGQMKYEVDGEWLTIAQLMRHWSLGRVGAKAKAQSYPKITVGAK